MILALALSTAADAPQSQGSSFLAQDSHHVGQEWAILTVPCPDSWPTESMKMLEILSYVNKCLDNLLHSL